MTDASTIADSDARVNDAATSAGILPHCTLVICA